MAKTLRQAHKIVKPKPKARVIRKCTDSTLVYDICVFTKEKWDEPRWRWEVTVPFFFTGKRRGRGKKNVPGRMVGRCS